jgi:cellulose synthase/poly-beta-1,6-N-acetylglucosamine synthase-like glycosyltransferase
MKDLGQTVLIAAYMIPAVLAMVYSLNLYTLLVLWVFRRRKARREREDLFDRFRLEKSEKDLPPVVTQIPVYNEYNVVERAMRAAAAMTYPRDRHTVQILDDSLDETRGLIDRVAEELRSEGHRVEVVRRPDRVGFKAGALEYGMRQSRADFFAIFDADFVPPTDFLLRTIPVLVSRPEVGLVQARWGHLNTNHSIVTRVEAIALDGHFVVDQGARAFNGLFMNFNGTAGLWRRQAIEDGGGWEHDTLTEDMDLSYRSQLAGWKCFYVPEVIVPAELPENINAFKTQQFRWAKGAIQTAIKLLPRVMRAPVSPMAKIQAFFHLTGYTAHPLVVWMALMSLPLAHLTVGPAFPAWMQSLTVFFVLGAVAPYLMYGIAQIVLHPRGWRSLVWLPALTLFGVGIAISNTRAVLEAVFGYQTAFIRTPKSGQRSGRKYRAGLSGITAVELGLSVYCGLAIWEFASNPFVAGWPFLLVYALAFSTVGLMSLAHALSDAGWFRPPDHPLMEADAA